MNKGHHLLRVYTVTSKKNPKTLGELNVQMLAHVNQSVITVIYSWIVAYSHSLHISINIRGYEEDKWPQENTPSTQASLGGTDLEKGLPANPAVTN